MTDISPVAKGDFRLLCANDARDFRIYLIFSITTTRIGKMIRGITRYPYNHVSVSLDGDLSRVYSFARHYKDTPLHGGFVRETSLRYYDGHRGQAKIMVCAIPVTAAQYELAEEFIDKIHDNNDKYLYNVLSAALAPVHVRVFIDRAYTCAEFGVELLAYCGVNEAPDRSHFCSIKRLSETYRKYSVYEGPFPNFDPACISGDDYNRHNRITRRVKTTVSSNARLIGRLCKKIISS